MPDARNQHRFVRGMDVAKAARDRFLLHPLARLVEVSAVFDDRCPECPNGGVLLRIVSDGNRHHA